MTSITLKANLGLDLSNPATNLNGSYHYLMRWGPNQPPYQFSVWRGLIHWLRPYITFGEDSDTLVAWVFSVDANGILFEFDLFSKALFSRLLEVFHDALASHKYDS